MNSHSLGHSFYEEGTDVTIEVTTEYILSKISECVKSGNYKTASLHLKYLAMLFFYAEIAADKGMRIPIIHNWDK